MRTFAQLGVPFRFFDAPVEEAARFDPRGHCSICLYLPKPCFRFGVGSSVVVRCRQCGTTHALDADAQEDTFCRACGYPVKFPRLEELWDFIGPDRKQSIVVCADCLFTGRAAINKRTEYGIVTWESAVDGLIDWVPDDVSCPLRLVPLSGGRRGAYVLNNALLDLVCTPMYRSWTTPVWLFCCNTPMTYIGAWNQHHFNQVSSDGDGRAFLRRILTHPDTFDLDAAWQNGLGYNPRVYVFRCRHCGRLRANWDAAPAHHHPKPSFAY